MGKKTNKFVFYYGAAEVSFEVDLEKFTVEHANATLTFFSWDYDENNDPIDEVMKKYALATLQYSMDYSICSTEILKRDFDPEGFASINGKIGITLLDFEPFGLNERDLEMEVSNG